VISGEWSGVGALIGWRCLWVEGGWLEADNSRVEGGEKPLLSGEWAGEMPAMSMSSCGEVMSWERESIYINGG